MKRAAHSLRWVDPAAFRTSRDSSDETSWATIWAAVMVWNSRRPGVGDDVGDDVAATDDAIRVVDSRAIGI